MSSSGQRLWKINRKFYALEPFLDEHPGGARMLNLARDYFDDSTFAFESHHTDLPRVLAVLRKYEVVDPLAAGVDPLDASRGPQLCPEGSFGAVLKKRVREHLRTTENGDGPDRLCVTLFWLVLATWFLCFALTAASGRAVDAMLTGACGALLAGFGHNWVHQPRYHGWAWVLDLEGLNGETWVMGHVLQHHMYTNLPADNHWSILEPFLVTDPTKPRAWLQATLMPWLSPVVFLVGSLAGYIALSVRLLLGACGASAHRERGRFQRADRRPDLDVELHLVNDSGHPTWLLCWAQLCVLSWCHGLPWGAALWFAKSGVASAWYLTIAFANHNSENAWRIEERAHAASWAEAQVYACSDIGRPHMSFLASARYLWLNYHTVHHLFPHTCMSKHPGIQRVLEAVCSDFGIPYCRGKSLYALYGEMVHTFTSPRDLAKRLAACAM
jgi:hypothetical protein